MQAALAVVVLAGCSNILGIDNLHGPGSGSDGSVGMDAMQDGQIPPDVIVAPHIRVSGTAHVFQSTSQVPAANYPVELLRGGDGTPLASGTTDDTGMFSLDVATAGMPVDAYLHFTAHSGEYDTYLYFPGFLLADTDVSSEAIMFSASTLSLLGQGSGPFGVAFLQQPDGTPLANATLTGPAGARITYCDTNDLPNASLNATTAAGIVMLFDMPIGTATERGLVNNVAFASKTIPVLRAATYFVTLRQP